MPVISSFFNYPLIQHLIKKNSKQFAHIVLAFLLVFLCAVVFLMLHSKANGFLILTQYHSAWVDVFFTYYTHLGDGLFCLLLALIFYIKKQQKVAGSILFSFLISGLIAQVFKYSLPMPRPAVFFREIGMGIHLIPGVTLLHSHASFPSGHTASAFALLTVLVLVNSNNKLNFLWLLLAFGVGYSRIYLANHFLADVLAGMVIGILSASAITALFFGFVKKQASAP